MSFRNEMVETPEDKEWFNSFHFKNPMGDWPIETDRWLRWTIDRERRIFLVDLGGQGFESSEIPAFAALVIEDEVVDITYRHGSKGDRINGLHRWYEIEFYHASDQLLEKISEPEIAQLIVEAYTQKAYGRTNDTNVLSVEVKF